MSGGVHARVGNAFDLLKVGLRPFIERELTAQRGEKWISEVRGILTDPRLQRIRDDGGEEDVTPLLVIMERAWGTVFRRILGKAERTLVNELIAFRERWTTPEDFTADDAVRALDSAARLLAAVSAPEALEVDRMTGEIRRARAEEAEAELARATDSTIVCEATGALKSWREIVRPTRSVASGAFRVGDFAADLWQVYRGEAADEYQKPAEFFRHTYLTESLKALLVGAAQRLGEATGDAVVQLQTHFGGGKTHALMALYHLFSGAPLKALPGVETLLKESGVGHLAHGVKRVVLAGNRISPGTPSVKEDGTIVRTLWGELAWQLGHAAGDLKGAKKAFHRVAGHDEKGTNPGDDLRQLLSDHGPCLILIDEWVAYARQLRGEDGLPGGRFETQFAFARSLVEAARLAKRCLVVVSLPAFEFTGSVQREDDQVGGQRGREALNRLYQAIGSAGAI